jgi:four helix bundle protein
MKDFKTTELWRDTLSMYGHYVPFYKLLREKGIYRLAEQMEASCGSVSDNIAEGLTRISRKEKMQFLYIAKASCAEFQNQLYRLDAHKIVNSKEIEKLVASSESILAQLQGLINFYKKQP